MRKKGGVIVERKRNCDHRAHPIVLDLWSRLFLQCDIIHGNECEVLRRRIGETTESEVRKVRVLCGF